MCMYTHTFKHNLEKRRKRAHEHETKIQQLSAAKGCYMEQAKEHLWMANMAICDHSQTDNHCQNLGDASGSCINPS